MKMPKQYITKTEASYYKTIEETCNDNLKEGSKLVDIFPCRHDEQMTLVFTTVSAMNELPKSYEVWEVVNIPNNVENLCNIQLKDNSIFVTSFPSSSPGIINLVFAQY